MSIVENYIGKVTVAVEVALGEPVIGTILEGEGYNPVDLQAIKGCIPSVQTAYQDVLKIDSDLTQATGLLETNFALVKKELAALRRSMTNNLPARSPLFARLGMKETQPRKQEALLEFAQRVFSSGLALTDAEAAPLIKRKWDKARFTAALAAVKAAVAANVAQEAGKGSSVAATAALYDRIDELDAAFRPMAKDARDLLKDQPGELTKMGLQTGVFKKPQRPVPGKSRKSVAPAPPSVG
jgi:hypothetical protein